MARLTGEGAIVVFPQGSIRSDRRGFDWAEEAELDYLSAVIEAIRTEFPGADRRVCLAGMSAGARMACRYAAARAEEVAAVGAVAGLRAPPTEPSQPVPVVAFHGLADRSISYLSGQGRYRTGSIPAAARAWAIANALEAKRSELRISPTLTKTSYGEGSPGEVTLWTFAGADQTWPGGAGALVLRPFLGRTSKELDASEEIWRFFRRHLADGG
jgi:polyhydroxybutyrate depolymerase